MRDFLARLGPADRVLLIGDTRQHQGVEAGRPFEQLQEAGMRTANLDQIVRQKDPALKSTVELLATGQTAAALDLLQQQGRIREIADPQERIRTIARNYAESPANTLIVSPDNASRRELNLAVREELKANGALSKEDHRFRVLVQRQDMTGADRAWANHYDVGDVVRYGLGQQEHGNRGRFLRNCGLYQSGCKSAYGRDAIRSTCDLRSAPAYRRQRLPRSCA